VIPLIKLDPGAAANASDTSNLTRRVWSALVLAPIGVAAAYLGGWLFVLICAAAAVIMLWEWTQLVVRSPDLRILVPGIAVLLAATLVAGENQAGAAVGMIVIGAALVGGVMAAWPRRYPASDPALWAGSGVIYAGIAMVSPVVLRSDPEYGFTALLFLFGTVWATDIFAYLTGRAIGGPLLWPQLSPGKTWAGAVGGLLGGVAAGTAVAYASGGTSPAAAGILAVVLSVAGQSGDLFESAIKRRFGVKDAGNLIPGHGGVMDRLDGFLVAALVAVFIGVAHGGVAAPGRGLLVW